MKRPDVAIKEDIALKNFYDSRLYHFLSVAAALMELNILTVLCSLPVFTVGASISALYAVLEQRSENRGGSAAREYFRAWKKTFKRATLFWCVLLAVIIVAAGDLFIVSHGILAGSSFFFLCVANVMLIAAVLTATVLFPFLPVFRAGYMQTLKISFVYALRYLPKTVLVAAINMLPFVLAYYHTEMFVRFLPAWLLLGFSAIAYCGTAILHPVILAIQEALDEQA